MPRNFNRYISLGHNECPCKGCIDRKVLCHSTCTKYKEWVDNQKQVLKWLSDKALSDKESDKHKFNTTKPTGINNSNKIKHMQ